MSVASIKLPRNTWGDKARLPARSLEARFAMDVHVLLSHMPLSLVSHCICWRYSPQCVAAVRLTQRIIVRSSGLALHVRCACSAHLRVRFPIPIHILSRICLFRPSAPRPLLHLSFDPLRLCQKVTSQLPSLPCCMHSRDARGGGYLCHGPPVPIELLQAAARDAFPLAAKRTGPTPPPGRAP